MKVVKTAGCFIMLLLLVGTCACSNIYSYGSAPTTTPAPAPAPTSAEAPMLTTDYAYNEGQMEAASEMALLDQTIEGIAAYGVDGEHKTITTINIKMESKEYDQSAKTVFNAVKASDGYIEFSDIAGNIHISETTGVSYFDNMSHKIMLLGYQPDFEVKSDSYRDGDCRFMQLRIRIPQTNLSGFLTRVEACGNVLSKQESSEDITLQYVDAESHIAALTTEQDRLLAMLEKAENVEEMIALEKRLSEIRYQFGLYESTLRVYKNQVSYGTVNLTLSEVLIYTENPETPVTVGERISYGWNRTLLDIQNYWKNVFVWLVVNLIYIISILIGIVIAVIILRKLIHRFLANIAVKALYSKEQDKDIAGAEQAAQKSKKKEL